MHRTRAGAVEHGESARQYGRKFFCAHQRMRERSHAGKHSALRRQLVQHAVAIAQMLTGVDAGNHQHRNRIGVGLRHGGSDIGHAGAGDDEADAGFATDPRIAVGHEAGALFVARCDVAHA